MFRKKTPVLPFPVPVIAVIALLSAPFFSLSADTGPGLSGEYYGELGCSHCDTFVEKTLPRLEEAAGVPIDLELYDILSTDGYDRCESRLQNLGYEFTIFPVLILEDRVYQGNSKIEEDLPVQLQYYKEHGSFPSKAGLPAAHPKHLEAAPALRFIPIFIAGLIDGINPCAFTTLLFFISLFGVRGKTAGQTAAAGLTFTAGIFISYLLIGFGLFQVFRIGSTLSVFRLILRISVSVITAVFCVISVVDYIAIKRGKTGNITLKLPKKLRQMVHASIRKGSVSTVMLAAVFFTGVVVAVLELACTGQVYFPTIAYMVQTDLTLLGIGTLLLYNAAFVVPILFVLGVLVFGTNQEKIRRFFEERLGFTKILLAGIFALLSVLIWLF